MLDKIKSNWTYILEGLVALMALALYFVKSKSDSEKALNDEAKTVSQVATLQKQVDINQGQLAAEEEKRAEIKKEADNAKSDSSDPTDYLNKR